MKAETKATVLKWTGHGLGLAIDYLGTVNSLVFACTNPVISKNKKLLDLVFIGGTGASFMVGCLVDNWFQQKSIEQLVKGNVKFILKTEE